MDDKDKLVKDEVLPEDNEISVVITEDDDDGEGSLKPEWKKKKIDDDERLSLRIDALEAEKYQDRHNKAATTKKNKSKKVSKKVKQLYEEDEDDDEIDIDQDAIRSLHELRLSRQDVSNGDSSLIDALIPEEKRLFEQAMTIENNRHQQNAGKLNAVEQADTLSRKAGLSKMSTSEQMEIAQEAIYNPRRTREKALEKNIEKKTGIKGKIEKGDEKDVVKGIKNIKETTDSRKTPKLNMEDVKNVGKEDMSQTKTAELILQKSGQKAKISDTKMRNAYDAENGANSLKKDDRSNEEKTSNKKQDVNKEMKELLNETLRKNEKVR